MQKPSTPPAPTQIEPRPSAQPSKPALSRPGDAAPCPVCGTLIEAPRGSKAAVCRICGFKDSCCY